MSLDYRKSTYSARVVDDCSKPSRTSYRSMNDWLYAGLKSHREPNAVAERVLADRYESTTDGAVHLLTPARASGYDDFHKAHLELKHLAAAPAGYYVPDSLSSKLPRQQRNGKLGAGWRHVRHILEPQGHRLNYIDGQTRINDFFEQEDRAFANKFYPNSKP